MDCCGSGVVEFDLATQEHCLKTIWRTEKSSRVIIFIGQLKLQVVVCRISEQLFNLHTFTKAMVQFLCRLNAYKCRGAQREW